MVYTIQHKTLDKLKLTSKDYANESIPKYNKPILLKYLDYIGRIIIKIHLGDAYLKEL